MTKEENKSKKKIVHRKDIKRKSPDSKVPFASVPRALPTKSAKVDNLTETADRSSIKIYLQQIGKTPLLTPAEEIELAALIKKGDPAARKRMIQSNLRLVVKIAHDYSHFGLPFQDLISEGNIGLMKAVERFDPEKGSKLSTYAAWWIKQAIKRALANQGKTIRLPVHLVEKISKIRKATAALYEKLGREPNNEEISKAVGMPVNKVAHLKAVSLRPASLDTPVGDTEKTNLGDLLGDESATTPLQDLQTKSRVNVIKQLMSKLNERDATILTMRFGLGGEDPKTLEEVGDFFGITRERVRQLQNAILKEIRDVVKEEDRQRTSDEVGEENLEREKMKILKDIAAKNHTEEKGKKSSKNSKKKK